MLVVQGEAGSGTTAPIRSMTASDICGFHDAAARRRRCASVRFEGVDELWRQHVAVNTDGHFDRR
jgi:hypothetical protein